MHVITGGFSMKNHLYFLILFISFISCADDFTTLYGKAEKDYLAGNYLDAFNGFNSIVINPSSDAFPGLGKAFSNAFECLGRLNKWPRTDSFREDALKVHPSNWRILSIAGKSLKAAPHYGRIINGKFERGSWGGVNSSARDRAMSIALLAKAVKFMGGNVSPSEKSEVYLLLADALMAHCGGTYSWKLQSLTDVVNLPDFQNGNIYGRSSYAPVDKDGNPVFYKTPESFGSARNDGERWRWALYMAEKNGSRTAALKLAEFLENQFGARTLYHSRDIFDKLSAEDGPYSLYSLADNETIALLSTGVKRFKLPDESNYIKIYRKASAFRNLADIYIERRQYEKAEECLRECLKAANNGADTFKQITGNFGEFKGMSSQAAGLKALLNFSFRNGKELKLTAHRIKIKKLLDDFKACFSGKSKQIPDIRNVGEYIVEKNRTEYIGEQVAEWTQKLEPAPHHWGCNTTIETPLSDAGAYLVEGRLQNGNTSRIVVWIEGIVLIRKAGDERNIFMVCDAVTGAPVADSGIEVFGYNTSDNENRIWDFTIKTDTNGVAFSYDNSNFYETLIATTKDGRLAFSGPEILGFENRTDTQKFSKKFCITDRPVYRPGDTVKFKIWSATPSYAESTEWPEKGELVVNINDPAGTEVFKGSTKLDRWGGVNLEFKIPLNAKLGIYRIAGWGTFRVEEYKKPEFEVLIENPRETVKLGEKFTTSINVRYYFGAPVTNAKVKYTVSRAVYRMQWFPSGPWDWLYGKGYWCFANLVPPPWADGRPETVMAKTVDVGPDGLVKIEVDTAETKQIFGDKDYEYTIEAEVTDSSRRTIYGTGSVVAIAKPFNVYIWTTNGYYNSGDTISVCAAARTCNGIPVAGKGVLKLIKIRYDKDGKSAETLAESWPLDTGESGEAVIKIKAAQAGQFKLLYTIVDVKNNSINGACYFNVFGKDAIDNSFKFNEIELLCDKAVYSPGEDVALMITAARKDSTVYLFVKPKNAAYPKPEIIKLDGHTALKKIRVEKSDMPNFFIEALTVSGAKVYTAVKEIHVPPEKKVLNVEVVSVKAKVSPSEKVQIKLKISGADGKPVTGQTVVTVYDKSLEYISGGSNVPAILPFFWKWKNYFYSYTLDTLKTSRNIFKGGEKRLSNLGMFESYNDVLLGGDNLSCDGEAPALSAGFLRKAKNVLAESSGSSESPERPVVVREHFADTAFWAFNIIPDKNGEAVIELVMPENLSTWKVKAWTMASGCRVGQGETELITSKDFIVRMEAPRFFVEGDQVMLSAIIHNYNKAAKKGTVSISFEGNSLSLADTPAKLDIEIPAGGEKRVDWLVKALKEGRETVTMASVVSGDSDGVKMSFPVLVHGMKKQISFSGFVPADKVAASAVFQFDVPEKLRTEESVLVINFRPSLAGVLADALPYLANYPYGCTEQTLNSFLPAVMVRTALADMKITSACPELDEERLSNIVETGMKKLMDMQLPDGGWGWFPGGRKFSAHLTSIVLHGLKMASKAGIAVDGSAIERAKNCLVNYQIKRIKEIAEKDHSVGDSDALVFRTLAEYSVRDGKMKNYLYENRKELGLYGKTLFALGLDPAADRHMLENLLKNIEQYLIRDSENQTVYLDVPRSFWWFWYGDDIETQAHYLELLMDIKSDSDVIPGLVKYIVCNRKNSTYWKSTRDTAYCIEALLEYFRKSGENETDMNVEIFLDGKSLEKWKVNKANLLSVDGTLHLSGSRIAAGKHVVEIRKNGNGRLFCDAYFSYFSLEDFITASGLDIKINRNYYLLKNKNSSSAAPGAHGQPVDVKVGSFEKLQLGDLSTVKSGEMVEVELVVESKNDYEYIMFEDMKAAGFESVELRSGYTSNALGAYMEFRDTKVCFFVTNLPRGKHSISYRLRAETPGRFSALPARVEAMYAPEINANSNEMKIKIDE
ncbi:MAG: hypothetical protein A2020_00095 [Lentisphaerae bacterium GWF2_45_14]|nr:MAG: hypothetical protein A2020_00095 [Lentisphaerae bacterium GWF2_45_14]